MFYRLKIKTIVLILIAAGLFGYSFYEIKAADDDLAKRLQGYILIQVEQNGEAWYVNPQNQERYYMGRPIDAFNLMKKLGIGITNKDLDKIQIEFTNLFGVDTDQDGLSDMFEDAMRINKESKDTDGDGHEDMAEVFYGYNANGEDKLFIDRVFADAQKGKIFLQVENHGEAWYINPDNGRKYFLARPRNAFSIMKALGLGIKDSDLEKIKINTDITSYSPEEKKESEISDNDNNDDSADDSDDYECGGGGCEKDQENDQDIDKPQENQEDTEDIDSQQISFEEKFQACEAGAEETIFIIDGMVYYMEIIGPRDSLCSVMSKYTEMPNPDWVDKEMVCLYDNTKDLGTAMLDTSGCSGPLYELMNSN